MPSINDALNVDTSGYQRVASPQTSPFHSGQLEQPLIPLRDSTLRFSAPYLPGTFPSNDTLRGYHLGGKIPQYRIPVPPQAAAQGAGTTGTSKTTIISSSSSTTTNNPAKAQTASLTTSTINPGNVFTGVIPMAKAFYVLTITVSAPSRIRLYATAMAQTADLTRPSTQGAGFGTEQGLIGDVVLDTVPVVWQAVNMTGANGDNPQSTSVYISIDNISNASEAVTASIIFVPLQS